MFRAIRKLLRKNAFRDDLVVLRSRFEELRSNEPYGYLTEPLEVPFPTRFLKMPSSLNGSDALRQALMALHRIAMMSGVIGSTSIAASHANAFLVNYTKTVEDAAEHDFIRAVAREEANRVVDEKVNFSPSKPVETVVN